MSTTGVSPDPSPMRCAAVLFIALAGALAAGLLAWGPLAAPSPAAPQTLVMSDLFDSLSGLALLAVGLWGLTVLPAGRDARARRRPWQALFALLTLAGLAAIGQPGPAAVAVHGVLAAVAALWCAALISERLDRPDLAPQATLAALLTASVAGAVAAFEPADLRFVFWLQALPLLLGGVGWLAGVAGPPRSGWVLGILWLLACAAPWGDAALLANTGWLSGRTVAQAALAGAAGWLAYAAACADESGTGAGSSSRRKTSWKTSSRFTI